MQSLRCGHAGLAWSISGVSQAQQAFTARFSAVPLHGGQLHGLRSVLGLSGVDPKTTKSSSGISSKAHRATVSLHQRGPASPEHSNSSHVSSHHHRQLRDDGSQKIIMLLALSLTLLLLPWVSHHPEFLLAPFVLAVMPVVGNGVRPVLKEVAAGFVTTLRLMGMAAWFDITHELPPQHNHHHNHLSNGHHSSSSSPGPAGQQQQQQAQQYGRDMYSQQQQAYSYQHAQHQPQPHPSGPHSPWPNPAYMPPNWPPQQQQAQPPAAAVGVSHPNLMSHPISEDADVDWAPSSPPDPHRGDPNSLQHLRQVLAADLQTEAELGRQRSSGSSNAVQGSGRRSPQQQRSPAGSPRNGNSPSASVASLDSADFPSPAVLHQQQQSSLPHMKEQQQQQQVAKQQQPSQQQQQQQSSSRDPRVLSREAKQQLYRDHHSHLHQQQNGGSSTS